MKHYLQYFQFGLLYVPTLIIGLVVYGSDFDSVAGWLYAVPLFALPLLHYLIRDKVENMIGRSFFKVLLLLGALGGLFLARRLYFEVWDEHSIIQAGLMSVLALCSYLLSVFGAVKLKTNYHGFKNPMATSLVLAVFGIFWFAAAIYPMGGFLVVCVIILFSLLWGDDKKAIAGEVNNGRQLQNPFEYKNSFLSPRAGMFLFFILSVDVFLVVWDFQVDSDWVLYLGLAFFAAAGGFYLGAKCSKQKIWLVLLLTLLNFSMSIFWPEYLLNPLRTLIAGLLWGYVMQWVVVFKDNAKTIGTYVWIVWLLFALFVGYAFYAHLAYAAARALLMLPLIPIAYKLSRSESNR